MALFVRQGIDVNWRDGDDDNTPQPVEGETAVRGMTPNVGNEGRSTAGLSPV